MLNFIDFLSLGDGRQRGRTDNERVTAYQFDRRERQPAAFPTGQISRGGGRGCREVRARAEGAGA